MAQPNRRQLKPGEMNPAHQKNDSAPFGWFSIKARERTRSWKKFTVIGIFWLLSLFIVCLLFVWLTRYQWNSHFLQSVCLSLWWFRTRIPWMLKEDTLWFNTLVFYISLPPSLVSSSETVLVSYDFVLLVSLQHTAGQKSQVKVIIVCFPMLKQEKLVKALCLPFGIQCCQKCQGNVSLSGLLLCSNVNPLFLILV